MVSLDQISSDWDELSNEYKDLEVIDLNCSQFVDIKVCIFSGGQQQLFRTFRR